MSTAQGGSRAQAAMVGRDHDLTQVQDLLRSGERLITLRGPGGIGKTTLARALADTVRAEYDHVIFVDLSILRDPQQVLPAINAALPTSAPQPDPLLNIVEIARNARVLLLLDNFEQLLPAAEQLAELLTRASNVQLVVTSRAALHLHDEIEYPLEPLALPTSRWGASCSPAVQLFVRRARATLPYFELTEENTEQVMRLCEALEGVPLAIELAASRLRVYALPDLLAKLEHPLNVLKADFRDRPERLRSLRAAVEWSYDLLIPEDRKVFECCAVFAGSFTPEALVAVWGDEEVLDRVESLIEQSFVQRIEGPVTRWRMLQPLRELAQEKLDRNESESAWRDRHARYYLKFLCDMCDSGIEPTSMKDTYLPEYPNLRAGIEWTITARDSTLAYRYVDRLVLLWVTFGKYQEGATLASRVLKLNAPEHEPLLRIRGLQCCIECLLPLKQFGETERHLRELRALSEHHGTWHVMWADAVTVNIHSHHGRLEEATLIARRIQSRYIENGGDAQAEPTQRVLYAWVLHNAVVGLVALGEKQMALRHALEALERFHELNHWLARPVACITVGYAYEQLGQWNAACEFTVRGLSDAIAQGRSAAIARAARVLSHIAGHCGQWDAAVRFAAFAEVRDVIPEPASSPVQQQHQLFLRDLERQLPADAYQREWSSGERLSDQEAKELARSLHVPDEDRPVTIKGHSNSTLTVRELDVLALVVQGHPDRRIAKLLNISPVTASKHVSNMLGKLGLHNRTELARWASEHRESTSIQ